MQIEYIIVYRRILSAKKAVYLFLTMFGLLSCVNICIYFFNYLTAKKFLPVWTDA